MELRPEWADALAPFARENRRNASAVNRDYIDVVSDALDAQYAFGGIDADDCRLATRTPAGAKEATAASFYRDAADASSGLLADVSRVFERLARGRANRREAIVSLLGRLES